MGTKAKTKSKRRPQATIVHAHGEVVIILPRWMARGNDAKITSFISTLANRKKA